jgi:hypothetical protein
MKPILCIFSGWLLFSCNITQENIPTLDKDQLTSEVIEMLENYHNDMTKEGLLSEFKYLNDSDDFFWVPPGYASSINYDSVRNVIESAVPGLSSVSYSWSSLDVYPLHNDIASFTGIVSGSIVDTAGVQTNVTLIESGTVIRRESGWKLLNGQSRFLQ